MQVLPLAAYALLLVAFIIWLVVSTHRLAHEDQEDFAFLEVPAEKMSKAVLSVAGSTGTQRRSSDSHRDGNGNGSFSCGP